MTFKSYLYYSVLIESYTRHAWRIIIKNGWLFWVLSGHISDVCKDSDMGRIGRGGGEREEGGPMSSQYWTEPGRDTITA